MDDNDSDSQTVGLIINVTIGIPTLLISFLLFDLARKRVPAVFEARRVLNHRRDPLDYHARRIYSPPPPSYRLFGWLVPVIRLDLDTIAETHGLDTALYLRFLRTMAALFLVLVLSSAALLPVFFTASNKNLPAADPLRTLGVQRFSLSNVPEDDSWRFWVLLALEFAITGLVCTLLSNEFAAYTSHRIRYHASQNPANYSILIQDIPPQSRSEDAVHHYWNRLFPGLVDRVLFVNDGRKLVAGKAKFWAAVTKRERAEWDMEFNEKLAGSRPTHKTGTCSCCRGASAQVDSIQYWTEQQKEHSQDIMRYQHDIDKSYTPPTAAAIVVFKTRRAAAEAAQVSFAVRESEWRVTRAPEPNAVNWNALSIGSGLLSVRTAITIISCVLLTLFWIIPVTAIMGLANLRALADITIRGDQPFSFLDNVSNWSPVVTGLIESLLPAIILSVFLGLVPTFLRMFVSVSRVGSLGNLDNTVRDWYFNFVTFSNFLFVALAGTLLNDLQQIISDPSSTIDLLATAVPKQAGFVMNFILLKALSETPQQILQIGRVAVRWIMLKFLARTARERRNVETGNTIFVYLRYYAMAQLIALLGLIYSTVQPFVIIVCFAYFAINYVVWKYNLCYSMNNPYHDGGSMYGGALYGVWVGLFVHLLTIMGLFGLNKKPAQCAISVIPLVFSILFIRKCKKRYARLLNHGSGVHTIQHIQQEDSEDLIPTSLAKTYGHPGFEPLPETIENLNGVGLNTGAVRFSDADDFDDTLVRIENGEEPAGESPRPSAQSESEDWKDAIAQHDQT